MSTYDGSLEGALEAAAAAICRCYARVLAQHVERMQLEGRSPKFIESVVARARSDLKELLARELTERAVLLGKRLPRRSDLNHGGTLH